MNPLSNPLSAFRLLLASCLVALAGSTAQAQPAKEPFQPVPGQPGKDVVWVPTPYVLVEKMLDVARVTPQDYVIDLGSGDGRNVIAAAKRGARALGVEYNPEMVALSRRAAAKEGVAGRASFVQADMFQADISQATVLALFLLPDNLRRLTPKFVDLRPGTRIVLNGFAIDGWDADETGRAEGDCGSWCTWHLYIVPAKVAGTWRLPEGTLRLEQKFQKVSGTFTSGGKSTPITEAQLRGDEISFAVNGARYSGRVEGAAMSGVFNGAAAGRWSAKRAS